MKTVENHCITE